MKLFSKSFLKKLVFSGVFTLILLIIVEIVLSVIQMFPNDYYVNTPNSSFTWKINTSEIVGIHSDSEVYFDELGSRSISDYDDKNKKIIALGGSTTACFALTQEKTWSALLEKKLGDSYWVGNFGRPGNSTNHNVLQLKQVLNLPELKEVQTVLIMQGANDFVGHLISPERYLNSSKEVLEKIAFQHIPDTITKFPKNLNLYKLAQRAKKNLSFYFKHKDYLTETANTIKTSRSDSKLIDSLPSLTKGLDHYEKNIIQLINLAKKKNVNIVFTTQATMWKPNLEEKYEKLITTSGFTNNDSFYTTAAFSKGMIAFNERLVNVCRAYNVPCIELSLPKTTASFYDDFHFNESGADLVSDEIYNFLSKKHLLK